MKVIEGELVDAPRELGAAPAQRMDIVCGMHAAWLDCRLGWPGCTQRTVPVEQPDTRTWTERMASYRVVDRRRL